MEFGQQAIRYLDNPLQVKACIVRGRRYRRPDRDRKPSQIGPIEKNWRDLVPFFNTPIKNQGFVAPLGNLEGMDHFLARIAEIERLTDQQARDDAIARTIIEQNKELSSIVDEFRANNFVAISIDMSSSQYDDATPELDERDAYRYGAPPAFGPEKYDREKASAYIRRIEWERGALQNGLPFTVRLDEEGEPLVIMRDLNQWAAKNAPGVDPMSILIKMTQHLRKAITNDWAYGPELQQQPVEQSFNELDAEAHHEQKDPQAPVELGLHNFSDDEFPYFERGKQISFGYVQGEPNEEELEHWDVDVPHIDVWLKTA